MEKERYEYDRDSKRRRRDSSPENDRRPNKKYDDRDKRRDNENRRDDNRDRREHSYSVTMGDGNTKTTGWYADSGATQHMTGNRELLTNFVPVHHDKWTVSGIGEAKLLVAGQGDVNLNATVNGHTLNGDYW
jgi:hypothetical protein